MLRGARDRAEGSIRGGRGIGLARDDDPFGSARRAGGPGGRRPGDARHDGHEGRRGQDPQAARRPGAGRLRRQRGRRVRAPGAVRDEAARLSEQRPPRGDRAGQALADRPAAPPAGGDAGRRRWAIQPAGERFGRRDPAQRRDPGDRLRRRIRPGRRAGAAGPHWPVGRGDRPRVARDRRRDRHLHQRQLDGGGTAVPDLTPREIVAELDRDIVGQADAKRAVAIALRNRWRRRQLPEELRSQVTPKNILLIGPTGVGKTEIARRLAKLVGAPFVKVEATKYTEVGYYGRDVESLVRDLVEAAIQLVRTGERERVAEQANVRVEQRLLDTLLPAPPAGHWPDPESPPEREAAERRQRSREKMKVRLDAGELEDRAIEVTIPGRSMAPVSILGAGNLEQMEMDLQGMFEKILPKGAQTRTMTVAEARPILLAQETEALIDNEKVQQAAVTLAEESGIVFLDEVDKIAGDEGGGGRGPDVSRQGVQRDLLPIVEGTTVTTKYGPVKTDHVLFIAAGAFHRSKPSDLMPELQGRFPIRVELQDLTRDDFARILREPRASLIRQYEALLGTEGVALEFTPDAIDAMADLAHQVNRSSQNIGARRLHTILERVVEDLSFDAPDRQNQKIVVDEKLVRERLEALSKDEDLSRYIL